MIPTTMVRLSDIEDDDTLAGGFIERRILEQCKAICSDCKKVVSHCIDCTNYEGEWTDYDTALAQYIDHRHKEHHA